MKQPNHLGFSPQKFHCLGVQEEQGTEGSNRHCLGRKGAVQEKRCAGGRGCARTQRAAGRPDHAVQCSNEHPMVSVQACSAKAQTGSSKVGIGSKKEWAGGGASAAGRRAAVQSRQNGMGESREWSNWGTNKKRFRLNETQHQFNRHKAVVGVCGPEVEKCPRMVCRYCGVGLHGEREEEGRRVQVWQAAAGCPGSAAAGSIWNRITNRKVSRKKQCRNRQKTKKAAVQAGEKSVHRRIAGKNPGGRNAGGP